MVLADSSVWIQHFRLGEPALAEMLEEGVVLMHPFVAGEIACGNLRNRADILADLRTLPMATMASNDEVSQFLEEHRLWGQGLGWVDLHLVASAVLSRCAFWTLDKRLALAARRLGLR